MLGGEQMSFGGQTFKLCDTCGKAIGIILEWAVLKDKEGGDGV